MPRPDGASNKREILGIVAVAAVEDAVENEFTEDLGGVFAGELQTGGLFD